MIEKKNTILVVDDEDEIRKMLNIFLDVADFKVVESENGKQAIRLSASVKPDLILLDLGLPDIDGKEVISTIRQWSNVPIIVLTARAEDMDAAPALNLGADDYVTKPFSAEVLLARINANLRKSVVKEVGEPDVVNGPIRMDLVRHEVFIDDQKVPFTPKEYDLLRYFLVNRGRMLTHKQILKEVWGPAHVDDTQYLRVYIGQVREKLEVKEGLSKSIVSESGIGYRMEVVA
ncbi:MAG: response regulator transcription factor [Asticcacaulis sp.]|uniref:response regulator n=1 Tax=Asticcacaulis tiandongensis TaxID=2565365 RepID=UPI001127E54B|nr:response regulator transcription factor [Asticcacaulis tiandongensis]